MFLIDSGILIRYLRSDIRASDLLDELGDRDDIAISAVTLFEVVRGSRDDDATGEFLTRFEVLDVDAPAARSAAELMRSFRGVLGGDFTVPDALIAGTALVNGATLVSLNRRQFAPLADAGLDLILIPQEAADWTSALP